ncbi:MAG: acyl-CoA dehydrogenase family protein [Nocardioidaceae bacterium]|nr:acyl-CoA dehydrogenase family protein [Nocardioidaceae bacterium]
MPIGITDDHAELAAALADWAASAGTIDAVRGAETDPSGLAGWPARAAELGLTSIALPDEVGGGGGTLLDQAVALEAAATALVPGPILGTTVAGLLVDDADLRAAVAKGSASVGLGLDGALRVAEGVLTGRVETVLDAPSATHLLLPVADGSWVVVAADRVRVEAGVTADLSRTSGAVVVEDVPLADVRRVRLDAADLWDLLVTLVAAECSGLARWCLDTAVDYAKVREQFGKPIGSFQAIKHLCAEMLETSESVTAVAWDAAAAYGEETEQRRYAALVAGTIATEGAVAVAKGCIQVLGGIGFTFEHDAHFYLRRALTLRSLVGGASRWARALTAQAAGGTRRAVTVDFDGADLAYRAEARAEAERLAGLDAAEQRAAMAASGYLAPHWPSPYGLGADPVQQLVIDDELARAGVERPDLKIGAWAAPTILQHGDDEQRERFLGPTLRGEIVWCQLFSEPGAGSDLASLRTKAVRADGGWLLTGQKVWTSLAHEADWGICLARTDAEAKPHAGISYFLVDMRAEGIDIRPLRELTGEAMFNEVFLDNVFVPDELVVGEVNGGWKLAVTTLANERVAMAGTRLDDSVERAVELAGDDPVAAVAVGKAVALATATKLLAMRATLRSIAGQGPGPESSVAKLVGVRSRQDSAELVVELLGHRVFTDDPLAQAAVREFLLHRCLSIAGGTTQILRNVAGERLLGLPRG